MPIGVCVIDDRDQRLARFSGDRLRGSIVENVNVSIWCPAVATSSGTVSANRRRTKRLSGVALSRFGYRVLPVPGGRRDALLPNLATAARKPGACYQRLRRPRNGRSQASMKQERSRNNCRRSGLGSRDSGLVIRESGIGNRGWGLQRLKSVAIAISIPESPAPSPECPTDISRTLLKGPGAWVGVQSSGRPMNCATEDGSAARQGNASAGGGLRFRKEEPAGHVL